MFKTPLRTLASVFLFFSIFIILVSGFLPYLQENILPNTSWGLYDRDFWPNLLVNVNSTLVDTLIIGILVLWLDSNRNRSEQIRQYQDAISDLRYYRGPDGPHRILSKIKRLSELKADALDLHDCVLSKQRVEAINFTRGNLHGVNLEESNLKNCNFKEVKSQGANFKSIKQNGCFFEKCDFRRSNFTKANLSGVDFGGSNLERANFESADLSSAVFKNSDLKNSNFSNATLRSANLITAINVTAEQLAQAKNIDYILVDPALLAELKILVPSMKISRSR